MSSGENYYNRWRKVSSWASWHVRKKVFDLFMKEICPVEEDSVVDVGITADLVHEADNFFEKFYPFAENITGVGVEDLSGLKKVYPKIKLVQADGRNLPFKSQSFDIVFSGAVLEHVGSSKDQKRFISEITRVGKKFFITTPNRWFPLEVHTGLPFLHYLPKKIYRKILKSFGMGFFAKEENLNLIRRKEFENFLNDKSVKIVTVKFLFLPVILVAIKN